MQVFDETSSHGLLATAGIDVAKPEKQPGICIGLLQSQSPENSKANKARPGTRSGRTRRTCISYEVLHEIINGHSSASCGLGAERVLAGSSHVAGEPYGGHFSDF